MTPAETGAISAVQADAPSLTHQARHDAVNVAVWFERVGQHYDDVLVSFVYDQRVAAVIKALPDWSRSWGATARVWRVHPGYAKTLEASLREIGCTVVGLDERGAA